MKITFNFVPDPSMRALWERFNETADARGISRDEALRQALTQWILALGGGVISETLDVTEKEFTWVRATLEALREQRDAV